MKKTPEEKPLKQLIDRLLIAYGLEDKINERKLMSSWENIAGKMVSKHTTDIRFKNSILFLELDSAPLRQELSYARDQLKDDLNRSVGKNIIKEIVLR